MRSRRVGLIALLGLLAGMFTATASRADPEVTDDDVRAARSAVAAGAAAVAAIELELAGLAAALDEAWVAVAVAAEDYTRALVERDEADARAEDAADRSARATAEVEAARADLGRIAQEAYRSGGALDRAVLLLSADGFEDYLARSAAIERMGSATDRAVQRFQAADVVARTLSTRAEDAARAAEAATLAAESALAEARRLQAAAEEQVEAAETLREVLVAELAALRRTSVEAERSRQEAVESQRAARPPASSTPGTSSSGGGSAPPSAPPSEVLGTGSQRGSAAQGEDAVAWAVQQVGKPYVYGAAGPDAFDCSGLTMRAWGAAGVSLPRTSRDQYRQTYKIGYDSMRPGDLIFQGTDPADPDSVYHVSMYIGGGQVVEASRPDIPVRVASVRWANAMPYAGRP